MHAYFKIRRWVLWWFYVGVVCGVIALVNIFLRDLTRAEEHEFIFLGVLHWVLGGVVCYALDGVQIAKPTAPNSSDKPVDQTEHQEEWHPASDFLFPGGRKSILPPRR
ncbi:MAG: hypothetical protein ABJF23_22475 [Bryobacteraceae bacterium]